eukprot:TRINITY_DN722_c0_g1_i3.p1 TRINITY_DN722_c0_g1~~TRINITY_DN722_c0_g1_i3.p1  ORF type:complete len:456 (-),score=146.80 TRINITY_DN722_c0_g1_i3:7-1374(-)
MVYHVFIKCDFPVKNAVVEFEDKKTTLADLKTLFGKACEVEEKKLDGYTLLAVSFGSLPRELITPTMDESARAKVMKQTLTELEVKDQSTIIAVAPVGSGKPTYKLSEKKEKSKDEEGETKDKSKKSADDYDETHYKGMTAKNILTKFTEAKDKKKKYATEFLEVHAKEMFKSKDWLKADRKVVTEILKLDGLNCSELEVYKALCAWAKENNKEKKDLNTFLGDLIELIRFPTMQAGDIASVAGDAVLTQDQILALFSFVGTKSKSSKPTDKSIAKFSAKARVPREFDTDLQWLRTSSGTLVISEKGKKLNGSSCYFNAVATTPRKNSKGQYIYAVRYEGGSYYMIGFAPSTVTLSSYSSSYFYSTYGYYFYSQNGYLYSSADSGRSFGASALNFGDVLTCVYDTRENTISFRVNDRDFGVGFRGVYGDLVPTLTNGGSSTTGALVLCKPTKIKS